MDSEILNAPREYRYREEDIDWVISKLERKAQSMDNHVRNTIGSMEQEMRSRRDRRSEEETEDSESGPMLDEETRAKLSSAGADADKYESLLQSLSDEQLLSLFAMEAAEKGETVAAEGSLEASFEEIPGLTEEQRSGLVEMERLLQKLEGGA